MGLMLHDSTKSFQGYTLFATGMYNMVYLIDNQGRLVNSWEASSYPAASFYLMENGDLVRTVTTDNEVFPKQGSGGGGRIERVDWDNNPVWTIGIKTCDHDRWRKANTPADGGSETWSPFNMALDRGESCQKYA